MGDIRYELRSQPTDAALIDELAARHARVGLAGVLRRRGTRAWPGRVPAEAAIEGFRWGLIDSVTPRWWPQGIEVLDAGATLLVSWFAQKGRGRHRGARITVVDRRDARRPRYHHVLLVEPVRLPGGERGGEPGAERGAEPDGDSVVRMRAVDIHAGGIAVVDNRLFVAATYGGLRVFDLDDILQVRGRGPFGYRFVLPQSGHRALHGGRSDERMRFSFVSVDHGRGPESERLVVGEFGPTTAGRLGRVHHRDDAAAVVELQAPSIPRMQGAAVIGETWFVTASHGVKPGDLWVGSGGGSGGWVRHAGVLPAGPEDLAASVDGRRLWSLCEYPRHRWVYAIDAARWGASG